MWLLWVCKEEENELGREKAPGSCPYCRGKVEAIDVEGKWSLFCCHYDKLRLDLLPFFKTPPWFGRTCELVATTNSVEEIKADEEPKRRKVENVNESKGEEGSAKTNSNLETSKEQANGKTNGHLENVGDKSSVQKSQQKGSVEVMVFVANISEKGFQRIQADQVEFADERLQDNSYWAKDGAESGYGAKAQEILGQVRGRDFRHEKTKKKRGTYRGGQIDLYSHSVKFNYSDEE
ncbi:hypothetical protein TanjilG_13457 [Lupinus angustifolius]|uniref:Srp40 C-terminal domain-containing protein n=1 Tax=Lupinus angustifolius TaxID=3871 RepID=A0A4P1RV82_LUPAN|nr:hypothetical protein TanjilG_13457 [Lupinus angustifolius]